jgi:cell wall-associated NlpC family hydrolase
MTSPGHVGIVVGTNEMIDAPQQGMDVSEQPISGVPSLVGYTRP